jgi:hypothetical protein
MPVSEHFLLNTAELLIYMIYDSLLMMGGSVQDAGNPNPMNTNMKHILNKVIVIIIIIIIILIILIIINSNLTSITLATALLTDV